MLRTTIKERINSILELQLQLHQQGIIEPEEVQIEVLEDCQQAAFAVGQCLEKELPDRTDMVEKLECYCEELYRAGSQQDQKEAIASHLDELICEVKEGLAQIPAVYQAVFMPYKAEMWDSLESVWMAFDKDESCEALVMPLPYSKFDAASQTWNPCYEGDRFPEYIPIMDYHTYDLAQEKPDFIFIHNAYDEYNRVTRISPEFFSVELKKYTKSLVYIPYFLTSGFVAEEHKMLSAYRYMDYMVVQSELYKSGFEGAFFYDRILPLGSPKLDRVIRICQTERKIPEEWKAVIGDKKCIMLNTSLGYFLHFGKYYLRRVRLCIDWMKENPIVALIWRPHPLFESTIRSMRPELLGEYQELVQYFLESGIGVLDQTPDIANTIAIVDGYIGDSWTSVTNLFGAAGRPMFILNASMGQPYTEEEQRRVSIAHMEEIDGKLWITPFLYNGLLCVENDWSQVQYVHRFEKQPYWQYTYGHITVWEHKLFLSPVASTEPVFYDLDSKEEGNLDWESNGKNLGFIIHHLYGDSIFYVSRNGRDSGIYEYKQKDKVWISYTEWLNEFISSRPADCKELYICGVAFEGKYIWITATYTNRVLRFDMELHTYKFYQIGSFNYGYGAIGIDGSTLYLVENHGRGKLIEVNLEKNTLYEYTLPESGYVFRNLRQIELPISEVLITGKYLILTPGYSNRMWRFDKESKNFDSMAEEFWEDAIAETENYLPQSAGVCNFSRIRNTTIWIQRIKDDAILILDVETGKYKVRYMYLSKRDYEKLIAGWDGFQKADITSPFVQLESRYFQFGDYIQKVAKGKLEEVKRRQREELITLAANMDGTCGEKVHEYFVNR